MASHLNGCTAQNLERSCRSAVVDWIKIAPPCRGLERTEAFFSGYAFDPHRHDTYAIGFTLHGVQSFRYRGTSEHSVPGQIFALHPDEIHDGHAGTGAGFRYKIAYIEPGIIGDALGGTRFPLPFVRNPVLNDSRIAAAIMPALDDLDLRIEDLQRDQIILNVADALAAADPSIVRKAVSAHHMRAVRKARDYLEGNAGIEVASEDLEAVTGLTRYDLARHFRACMGTSPYRYLTMRRLDMARSLIRNGATLVEAALASGFADQSHMTRHFKRVYGLPPGRWARIVV